MMPKRLTEPGSGASDLERILLASRSEPKPSERERALLWQNLLQGIAVPSGKEDAQRPASEVPPPVQPSTGSSQLLSAGLAGVQWTSALAGAGVGLALGVLVTSGYFLLRGTDLAPTAATSAAGLPSAGASQIQETEAHGRSRARSSPPPSVAVDELQLLVDDAVSVDRVPSKRETGRSVAPDSSAAAAITSRLREEATLLRRAREQLGRGELDDAASTLSRSRTLFPDSRLLQEREALTIELLVRQGRKSEAASLAKAFVSKYPHSPHAVQVRRAVGDAGQSE